MRRLTPLWIAYQEDLGSLLSPSHTPSGTWRVMNWSDSSRSRSQMVACCWALQEERLVYRSSKWSGPLQVHVGFVPIRCSHHLLLPLAKPQEDKQ